MGNLKPFRVFFIPQKRYIIVKWDFLNLGKFRSNMFLIDIWHGFMHNLSMHNGFQSIYQPMNIYIEKTACDKASI